jgi:hypothetical protein
MEAVHARADNAQAAVAAVQADKQELHQQLKASADTDEKLKAEMQRQCVYQARLTSAKSCVMLTMESCIFLQISDQARDSQC